MWRLNWSRDQSLSRVISHKAIFNSNIIMSSVRRVQINRIKSRGMIKTWFSLISIRKSINRKRVKMERSIRRFRKKRINSKRISIYRSSHKYSSRFRSSSNQKSSNSISVMEVEWRKGPIQSHRKRLRRKVRWRHW